MLKKGQNLFFLSSLLLGNTQEEEIQKTFHDVKYASGFVILKGNVYQQTATLDSVWHKVRSPGKTTTLNSDSEKILFSHWECNNTTPAKECHPELRRYLSRCIVDKHTPSLPSTFPGLHTGLALIGITITNQKNDL